MIRRLVKAGVARALCTTGVGSWIGAARRLRRGPLIVGYHRVVEDFRESARHAIPSMLISAGMLERHLDWIGRRYRFVSLDELGRALQNGGERLDRMAAVTFDDGYRDVYENAFPILERKGVPAAVFVVAEHVDTSRILMHDRLYLLFRRAMLVWRDPAGRMASLFCGAGLAPLPRIDLSGAARSPFSLTRLLLDRYSQGDLLAAVGALDAALDPEPAEKESPNLSWEMLARMRRAGWTIGSHTLTHVVLTHEPQARQLEEIGGSRRLLQERLGVDIDHVAYPDGCFDAWTVISATVARYRFGYTICRHVDPYSPFLTLPRRILWEGSCVSGSGSFSAAILEAQVHGVFDLLDRCQGRHGPPPAVSSRRAV